MQGWIEIAHSRMPEFEHERHKPPRELIQPRELVVVCAPMRSNINLSRIARAAVCCGLTRMICCGPAKLDRKIARDAADTIQIESHRTLRPVLEKLREEGFRLVGLEQTSNSQNLHHFQFERRTALVIGNERTGLTEDILEIARRRRGDPRVGSAVQLQRGDCDVDVFVRILPAVSRRLKRHLRTSCDV